ncbi:MAG: ECF transporter S component [Clostridia bacterium]|nr:ECF transporter S component [Clostridia bacterium]
MKKNSIRNLVMTALFCALICVVTAALPFPVANGYANLGDAVIAVCAYFTGPVLGFVAAGVGSALADLILGYAVYAPATLIIKGTMAVVFYLIFRPFANKKSKVFGLLLASAATEALMVVGYFLFECILYSPAGALQSIPQNLIQAAAGFIGTTVTVMILSHNKFLSQHSVMDMKKHTSRK